MPCESPGTSGRFRDQLRAARLRPIDPDRAAAYLCAMQQLALQTNLASLGELLN